MVLWRPTKLSAAKSLQSCPTLCNPRDGSPPGSPVPGILQARTLEWVAISFSNAWKRKLKVKSLSHVRLLATPWTAAHQAPPSMGFSRQEYWSGVPLPSPKPSRTPKKDVLFIIGDWNAKVGSQEIPGVTGKFGLGVQNEAGKRVTEFFQENALVIANTLFQQHKRRLHMDITRWSTSKADWLYSLQPKMEKLYTANKNTTGSWLWLRSWNPYVKFKLKLKKVQKNH